MFKPSLKRSKLSQISISTSPSLPHRASVLKQQAFTVNKAQAQGLSIPQLFTKPLPVGPSNPLNRIVMPLTYCTLEYPLAVKEKLSQPIHHVKSRMVGSKFGVYWLLSQNQLYIWTYDSVDNPTEIRNCRKFEFQQNLRAIELGLLDKQKCCLINTRDTCQTMAIGFESSIDLYTIDLKTLELNSMSIKFKMQFNQTLDRLHITHNNQILFTGDQGFLTRVLFDAHDKYGQPKISKQSARPTMFGATNFWSSLELSKTNTRRFTECILPSIDQKVYVLVRKQSQGSFLRKMSLAAIRLLSGRIKNDEQSQIIQKQIHVYDTQNKSKKLRFSFCISNLQIESKIRKSFGANDKISKLFDSDPNFNMASSIASIFLAKGRKEVGQEESKLCIMTNYGLFLSIGFNRFLQGNVPNFSFDEQPKTLPEQLFQTNQKELSNTLFLKSNVSSSNKKQTQGNNELEPFAQKKNKLINSFGQGNLNVLSNGLCFYFDESQLQIVKLNKHPGFIAQSPIYSHHRQLEGNMWLVFSKTQITMIKKSQIQDLLLAGISAIHELEKEGVAKGEKSEDYQFYTNMMIEECCKIIGKTEVSHALCSLLLKISKIRVSELPLLNNKGEVIVNVSNQAKEVVKQEMRIKIRALQRSKSAYASNTTHHSIGLFSRWLIPKADSIKLYQANINFDVEESIWKSFILTSLENSNERSYANSNQNDERGSKRLARTSQFLIRYFQKYYEEVKHLSMTELRRSPIKVKQSKHSLMALFNFLSAKRNKSYGLLQKLIYSRAQNKQQIRKSKNDTQNLTMESLNSSTMPTLQSNTQQGADRSWNPSSLGETMSYWRTQYSIEEIENQLCSTITKLINVIELYQVLVSNSQSKYESLPNIHQFMISLSAKKEVKAALLDLFSSACLYSDPTMLRFSQILPELRLNADIYLAKWLKFVNLANTNQKEFDAKSTINAQLKISDLEELSRKVELEQLAKVRHFFKQNSATYINILINQLAFRTIQLQVNKEFIKSSTQSTNQHTYENISIFDSLNSVFADDKLRANLEWKEWLSSQISLIRIEIGRYLQELALSISESSPELYLIQQKQFDECVKALDSCVEGPVFVKQVIDFLKQKSLLAQKVYRLSLLIKSKESKSIPGLFTNVVRPESMSTFQLLRTEMKKSQQEVFGKEWLSQFSKKGVNGQKSL